MQKIAVLSDLHAPYHSRPSLNIFLKVMKWWKPDILVQIGDLVDLYAVSRHDKDPLKDRGLKHELATVNKILEELKPIGARKIITLGNHDQRLESYINKNAPALAGMLTLPDVLDLEGWEIYPYQEPVTIGKISFVHDLGYAGKTALRSTIDSYPANLVFGHTHRREQLTRGNLRREKMTITNFGWMGDSRAIDYLPSVKVKQDWCHGFGMIYLDSDGTPHVQSVPIERGKAFVEGKIWR